MTAAALTALTLSLFTTQTAADPTAGLTTDQLSGQRLVVGFRGTTAPKPLLRRISRGELSGVILFAYNIRTRQQTRRLTSSLQQARPAKAPPLLIATDQEGGLVKRLNGAPTRAAADMRSAETARRQGEATARNLRQVGINVNFAPVLDVARRGGAIDRQRRAFGRTPLTVARRGAAFAKGLARGRVIGTAKHFPGLGAARADQDLEANTIRLSRRTLRRIDEVPYRAHPTRMIMLSSATYPAFSNKPAVFSAAVDRELRGRLRFDGVTISDALDAPAFRRYGARRRKAISDILLFSQQTNLKPPPDRQAVARILALRESASAP